MKVLFVPFQPHCFAFGGFDLQMLGAMEAVRKLGVTTVPLDPWSREIDFEIVHCWGLELAHAHTIEWAKKAGLKVVVSGLIGSEHSLKTRLRFVASSLAGRVRLLKSIVSNLDAITVVNELEAHTATHYHKIPSNKVHVVPNIIAKPFLEQQTSRVHSATTGQYVLSTGNICTRKNQLNLAMACRAIGVSLIVVGRTLTGEEEYAKKLERFLGTGMDIQWIKGLPANSEELLSLYGHCAMFALPSFQETQPISALEAVALERPLLLGDAAYSRQRLFAGCCRVDPASVKDIAKQIAIVLKTPHHFVVPKKNIVECSESIVGEKYRDVYQRAMYGNS